jgi:zinc/manganese transport system ATP-binding protein
VGHNDVGAGSLKAANSDNDVCGPAVTFDNVTLGYDRHPAVHHLSGTVGAGSLLAVVGPNGAGKSTLLKGIAGLSKPLEGHIRLGCEPDAVGYLPQVAAIDRSFPINVTDFVSLGLWREIGFLGRITAVRAQRIRAAIEEVGLQGYERRSLDTLSGGQLARALFARLIVQDSQLMLLDEPFAAIDHNTSEDLCRLLERWRGQGRTIIAVLHDFGQVRAHFPDALLLAREVIAWGPTAQVLTPAQLASVDQRLRAFDDHAPWCEGTNLHNAA